MNQRMKKLIREMPKAENHIHIEGSIPARTALALAGKNNISLPFNSAEEMQDYISTNVVDLNSFMKCNRMINSVCIDADDYFQVIYDLGEDAKEQNIIYQEFHLDYPLNGERGIPLNTVMEGYNAGRKAVLEDFGVEIIYIAGIDRTLAPEKSATFVRDLEPYLDTVRGVGMDCEEKGYPCVLHKEAYEIATKFGLFKTAHAGEDDGSQNIWDALLELGCDRIDHGVRAIDDEQLMQLLAEKKILLTICTNSNVMTRLFESRQHHPLKTFTQRGIVCSLNSDDPPYVGDLISEYENVVRTFQFSEEEIIDLARNAFEYSIAGQHLLPKFDNWVKGWLNS